MPQSQKNPYHTGMRIRTELNFLQTLPSGPEYFELFGRGAQLLILGIGPDPEIPVSLTESYANPVYFMECPEILEKSLFRKHGSV